MSDTVNQASDVLVADVADGLTPPVIKKGECRKFEQREIAAILRRNGPMLLLDYAEIRWDTVVGFLTVTPERCPGFCFVERELLMLRGPDIEDMAAQLLGVYGSLFPALVRIRNSFVLARTGTANFHRPAMAGETILMEIPIRQIILRPMMTKGQYTLFGRKFTATINTDKVATISNVHLLSRQHLGGEDQMTDFEKRKHGA